MQMHFRALRRLREQGDDGEEWQDATEEGLIEDPDTMTYDDLLNLGAQLGDVRRDRWRQRSAGIIASLQQVDFDTMSEDVKRHYRDEMCLVCHCAFESNDKLRLMPFCSHSFHVDCIDVWLQDNNTCVTCKALVEKEE